MSQSTSTLEEVLAEVRCTLERICAEQGISLDQLPARPLPGVDAALLRNAAFAYARALHDAGIGNVCVLLAGKAARIASYLDETDDDGVWEVDAVPNLLLIEKLLVDIDAEVGLRRRRTRDDVAARVESSRRLIHALLTPLFETIPPPARRVLAALVAAGRAPSPFVRLAPRGS